jgi:putative DNA primase/helicase
MAVEHNDNLLVLDEIGQVKGKDLAESAYMLANGVGKNRAGRGGEARPQVTWLLLFLSSGELGLAERLAEEGLRSHAGQEVRFVGIPVSQEDIGNLHSHPSSGALVNRIKALVNQHYGHAGRFYLEWMLEDLQAIKEEAQEAITTISKALCPEGAREQVQRVARRFAIVHIAGSLAKQAGILPESIDVGKAVSSCFSAWIDSRGSIGLSEDDAIKSSVRAFIAEHGASRFQDAHNANAICPHRVGFKHELNGRVEYLIIADLLDKVVVGHEPKRVGKVLKAAGWISRTEGGRNTIRCTLPGMSRETYYAIILPEEE